MSRHPLRSGRLPATVIVLTFAVFGALSSAASAAPTLAAKTDTVSNASYTSAHVTGHVSTPGPLNGFFENEVRFQYSTDQVNWTTSTTKYFRLAADEKFVEGDLTGLKGDTTYYARITITAFPDTAASPAPYLSFTTLPVEPPTISVIDDASEVFSRTAAATGKVKRPANPDPGFDVTACRFEYVTDADFASTGFQGASSQGCEFFNPITAPGEEVEVGAELEGLTPGTTYHLRLAAENAAPDSGTKEASPFTTNSKVTAKPPVFAANDATDVDKRFARASGEIERPAGADPALDTECRFEYVTDEQFTENIGNSLPGFEGAAQSPCAQNPVDSPNGSAVRIPVSAELQGLTPDTTYHLRLTAENGAGAETKAATNTFKTPAIVHPQLTVNSVTDVSYTRARVTFTVGPGNQGAYATLSYSVAGTNEWFGDAPNNGIIGINVGEAPRQFTIELGPSGFAYQMPPEEGGGNFFQPGPGLRPGTKYQVRVGAFDLDEFVERYSEPAEFTTTGTSTLPSVGLDPVTTSPPASAHFTGFVHINAPAEPLPDEAKAAYRTKWHLECTPQCNFPNLSGTIEVAEGGKTIDVETDRLESNTFYENVTLVAENALGIVKTPLQQFSTPLILPTVQATPGGSAGGGSYNVGGVVTPFNSKISNCHFEYGPTTEYVYSAPCSPDPVGRNEVQKIYVGGLEGQFKLIFRGQTTGDITIQAPASVVEDELKALSAIGKEGVTDVEREIGFFYTAYTIHFAGPLSSQNLGSVRGIEGTLPLCNDQTSCHVGNPGNAATLIEGGNNAPVLVEAHLTGLTPGATYHYQLSATNPLGTVRTGDNLFVTPHDVGEAACPNEQERIENSSTRLPECRAYELVTNAPKAGFSAGLSAYSNNEAVGYSSTSGNIENSGQGNLFGNQYLAKRTDNGWQTVAGLNGPKGSPYTGGSVQSQEFKQYSPDLERSIWFRGVKGENQTLYLREASGEFKKMNPAPGHTFFGPQSIFQGASQDLSHTFWLGTEEGETDVWGPGLSLGVYEYEGTGNTALPRRLDVKNNGEPISECAQGGFYIGVSWFNATSADGKTVFFTRKSCEGRPQELYARVDASKTIFVSESQCTRTAADPGGACYTPALAPGPYGEAGSADSIFQSATLDGSRVYFTTSQQLVNDDTNKSTDLYRYELPSASNPNPSPALIQVSNSGPDAQVQQLLRTSEDGSTVYFIARGVLASNHDSYDEPPHDGDENMYVWHQDASHPDGQTTFIGKVTDSPRSTSEITPDGRYFLFRSISPLTATDTDNATDIYRYDLVTSELVRVSVDPAGTGGNGDGLDANIPQAGEHTHPSITDDGQEVIFFTPESLSSDDGNGASDIYLWKNGHSALISTGSVGGGASSADLDGSGRNIYFETGQQLTPEDTDSVSDVYDARIDGGVSFARHENCVGEGCQPSTSGGSSAPALDTDQSKESGDYRPATISIKPLSASQRAILAAGGEAEVPLKVSGPGKISLSGTARLGKKSSRIIDASSRAVQAGVVEVPITLSGRAASKLRRSGALSVQLAAVIADSETATATLKLKQSDGARRKRSKRGND